MKNLLIILLTLISSIYSQTFNCIQHFDGIIENSYITWNKIEDIKNTKLTINHNIISVENNKFEIKLLDLISKSKDEVTYYAEDWNKINCYVIIESFSKFKYIYFQYSNVIFGYKLVKL